MQALFMRTRTGEGQLVDSAMYDNMLSLNEAMIALYSVAGQSPHRGRPRNAYPRGAYKARDGYVAVNVPDERIWRRWCETMNRPDLIDDARTNGGSARAQNRDFLDPIIDEWFAGLTRHEAVERLNDAGVPTGPVHTAEDVFACPQVEARGMLMEVHDRDVGDYRFARTPPHLSAAPLLPSKSAPDLGQHTRSILSDLLGYNAQQIDELVWSITLTRRVQRPISGQSWAAHDRDIAPVDSYFLCQLVKKWFIYGVSPGE
jgi:crotonobetainyl-CoA:carnitine CoA-transferase CaiB-like acyl-CoA transferase